MSSASKEARVILALQALQNDTKLSLQAAAKLYNVLVSTFVHRRTGRAIQHDLLANLRKLTDLEEETIVQYMIELYERAFPLWLSSVEDMAN